MISPSDSHMSAAADAEAVNVNEGFIPAGTRKSERHCCTSKKRDKAEVMSSRCDVTQMHIPGHDDMRMNSFCLGFLMRPFPRLL